MTNREFYTAIINGTINEEVILHAQTEIANLDRKNEKRRNTLSKEQVANEELKGLLLDLIGGRKGVTASVLATEANLSTQKVSALCRQMVESGLLTASDIKVKGKGAVKGYTAVESGAEYLDKEVEA